MDNNTPKYVNLSNARHPEQASVMQKIVDDGVCPFCPEHLANYHKEPILKEGAYWLVTKNQWPYDETKHHFLAIAKDHVEDFTKLPPEAGKELIEFFQNICTEYNIAGGGLAMRFGSGEKNYANSVSHLHCHLIEPDMENPQHTGVKFKLSKSRVEA